jgi:hypothetical protein
MIAIYAYFQASISNLVEPLPLSAHVEVIFQVLGGTPFLSTSSLLIVRGHDKENSAQVGEIPPDPSQRA